MYLHTQTVVAPIQTTWRTVHIVATRKKQTKDDITKESHKRGFKEDFNWKLPTKKEWSGNERFTVGSGRFQTLLFIPILCSSLI